MSLARRDHVVGYPARETQPCLLNGLRRQHGVVNTAELDADNEYDRELLGLHPVSKRLVLRERRKPPACTFHQHPVGLASSVRNPADSTVNESTTFVSADDVRRGRFGKGVRIDR